MRFGRFRGACAAALLLLLILSCACRRPEQAEGPTGVLILTPRPAATAVPTPSPTPMPTPTPSPTPTPDGLLGGRYAELLTPDAVGTESSYGCLSRYVSVRKVEKDTAYAASASDVVTYFVADVYVQDVTTLRCEAAKETFSAKAGTAAVSTMAERVNAIVAVSGDYYTHDRSGIVLRNGELFCDVPASQRDICVLYADGTMQTYPAGAFSLEEILAREPWQIWSFGPALLDDGGQPIESFRSSVRNVNPRCAIGCIEPGHYCFVVVDGRRPGYSNGVTLKMLARLMYDLGCTVAYNLDGGASAQMYWNGAILNTPSGGGRAISDIVYIAFPTE